MDENGRNRVDRIGDCKSVPLTTAANKVSQLPSAHMVGLCFDRVAMSFRARCCSAVNSRPLSRRLPAFT